MKLDTLEQLYQFSIKSLEIKLERKHHLETKILALLQATTILTTIFVILSEGTNKNCIINIEYLKKAFYICVFSILLILLFSLNDSLRKIFDKSSGFGRYAIRDLPRPNDILNNYSKDTIYDYYIKIITSICDTITDVDNIIQSKTTLFNIGLYLFLISIMILILMGWQ